MHWHERIPLDGEASILTDYPFNIKSLPKNIRKLLEY